MLDRFSYNFDPSQNAWAANGTSLDGADDVDFYDTPFTLDDF